MHGTWDGFVKLDSTVIPAANRDWQVTVYSSHVASNRRWLQINLTSGPDTLAVLLNLSLDTTPGTTVDALKNWLSTPSPHDSGVIEIG